MSTYPKDFFTKMTPLEGRVQELSRALRLMRIERDGARQDLADAPHGKICRYELDADGEVNYRSECTCWKAAL